MANAPQPMPEGAVRPPAPAAPPSRFEMVAKHKGMTVHELMTLINEAYQKRTRRTLSENQ